MAPIAAVGMGAIIGFSSGLFGVGGSSVATPLLRLMDVPRFAALASPLPVNLPTAIVGGITYWLKRKVRGRLVLLTALTGAPAVVAGSYLSKDVPGRILMALTGGFVVVVSLWLVRQRDGGEGHRECAPAWLLLAIGAITGFLSGLLANGGGFLLMPAYLLLCRLDIQEAAATSLVAALFLAVPGTIVH
ncbi:MAG TPA: sulfite exporter TauE/SafE family protein, partial [bacterium]|nr:sulfite exporter TauE/SafE family protein [bacterium]